MLPWILSDFRLSEFSNAVYLRREYPTEDVLKILISEVVCCVMLRTARIRKFCSLWKNAMEYIKLILEVVLKFLPGRLRGVESLNGLEKFLHNDFII